MIVYFWLSEDIAYKLCTNVYEGLLHINCPMSCNHCMPSAPPSIVVTQPCEDERPWCSRFARNGLCQTYLFKNYMESRCPLSCGAC
ncbi:hypothetical protein M3Y97_00919200 [Aphelenchoides bicaudatus]|nr:hypothetical protein M3Y97_00919200 [Aphelenchoides bicaudatus]